MKPSPTILTKNTDKLRSEVAAHVAADSIAQGSYWDDEGKCGCWIGCLAKGNYPLLNEEMYGLPVMVQRIAESIFEALSAAEAKAFFACLPDAVDCDNKDLTAVGWLLLAAELRALPEQSSEIQAAIDPVIAGMGLLANGQPWAAAGTAAGDAASAAAGATATHAADAANAAWAAADAAWAVTRATDAIDITDAAAWADWAATRATDAIDATTAVADAAAVDAAAAARLRQRDLLLRLIAESPVVKNHQ